MILDVVKYGHPVLREKGEQIESFDEALAALASNMLETMYAADGIGLAAQQIGEAKRLFVMDVPPEREEDEPPVSEPPVSMPIVRVAL